MRDPNRMLQRLREALLLDPSESLRAARESGAAYEYGDEHVAAYQAFYELDEWLSKGGALPDDWQRRDPEPARVPVDPFA